MGLPGPGESACGLIPGLRSLGPLGRKGRRCAAGRCWCSASFRSGYNERRPMADKYAAFISYAHRDKVWVRVLQENLERCLAAAGRAGLVFLDEVDLPPTILAKERSVSRTRIPSRARDTYPPKSCGEALGSSARITAGTTTSRRRRPDRPAKASRAPASSTTQRFIRGVRRTSR